VLALLLIILALMLIASEALVRGRSVATMNPRAVHHPIRIRLGASEIVFQVALGLVVAISLAFPIWRVLLWVTRYGSDQDIGDVATALWGSLRYSFVAALVTVILALPIGLLAGKYRSRTASVIAGSTYVTHALPGVVVAISMVFIGVRFLPSWYLEAPLLVLAYVALFLPLAVGGIRAIVAQIPPTLDDVARSLGSTPLQTVRRVSLPLIVPGIAASSALVLLAAMKELPVTMLLRPTGTETLATRLWTQTTVSDYAAAGPYALALIIFVALPTALASIRS
jgi:iron(III) transport system permease protein